MSAATARAAAAAASAAVDAAAGEGNPADAAGQKAQLERTVAELNATLSARQKDFEARLRYSSSCRQTHCRQFVGVSKLCRRTSKAAAEGAGPASNAARALLCTWAPKCHRLCSLASTGTLSPVASTQFSSSNTNSSNSAAQGCSAGWAQGQALSSLEMCAHSRSTASPCRHQIVLTRCDHSVLHCRVLCCAALCCGGVSVTWSGGTCRRRRR